jgi:hypothetical protein
VRFGRVRPGAATGTPGTGGNPDAPLLSLDGVSPDGGPVSVPVGAGSWTVLLLTASCDPCRKVWESLSGLAPSEQVVVVTPSPSTESSRAVRRLAPAGTRLVMASEIWLRLARGPAPWAVELEEGKVVGSGPAVGAGGSLRPARPARRLWPR